MRIVDIDPLSETALALLRDAAAEVRPLYAQPSKEPMAAPANDPPRGRDLYVAAFLGGSSVGCGALRELDRTTAEVRRMYVRSEAPAIAFYENHGFRRIEAFGKHVNDSSSLCYELQLDGAGNEPAVV
jgi:putative acetyltransferase